MISEETRTVEHIDVSIRVANGTISGLESMIISYELSDPNDPRIAETKKEINELKQQITDLETQKAALGAQQ